MHRQNRKNISPVEKHFNVFLSLQDKQKKARDELKNL